MNTSKGIYTLKYTYNAFCEYENRFGRSLIADISKSGLSPLRGLIWAGLLHMHPQYAPAMTEDQVGDLIEDAICNGANMEILRNEVVEALNTANFIVRLAETGPKKTARSKTQEKR